MISKIINILKGVVLFLLAIILVVVVYVMYNASGASDKLDRMREDVKISKNNV